MIVRVFKRLFFTLYLWKIKFLYLGCFVLLSLSLKGRLHLFVQQIKIRRLFSLNYTLRSLFISSRLKVFTCKFLLKIFLHSRRKFCPAKTILSHSGYLFVSGDLLFSFFIEQINRTIPWNWVCFELELVSLIFSFLRGFPLIKTKRLLIN